MAGGAGGDAGAGGEGGSGGNEETLCGNGILDEGEECDDGNRFDFDGCSAECKLDGTCENPIPWGAVSVAAARTPHPNLALREVERHFRGHETQATACGNEGRQMVYEFVSPVDGRFFANFQNKASDPDLPRAFVTRDCDLPEEALICDMENSAFLSDAPVSKGERLFLVVDGGGVDASFLYLLSAGTIAPSAEGESCSRFPPDSTFSFCAPGHYCTVGGECVANHPPVLRDAKIFRHGPENASLTYIADVLEEDPQVVRFLARFFDESGAELTEEPHTLDSFSPQEGSAFQRRTADFFHFFPELADATEVEFWVEDTIPGTPPQRSASEKLRLPLADLPRPDEGEGCDPERMHDLCGSGLACEGEPARCASLLPLRTPICDAAQEASLGEEIEFILDANDVLPPYFELPQDCLDGWTKRESWYEQERMTEVLRFSTAVPLENVHMEIWKPDGKPFIDLGLMILPGCGAAEPLVCVDEIERVLNPESEIYESVDLPELPPGDYLVVVRNVLPAIVVGGERVRLKITADPVEAP